MVRYKFLVAMFLLLCSSLSMAESLANENRTKDHTLTDWATWPLVGKAQLSWFLFDIYQSELRTPDGHYRQSDDVTPHPAALIITYQRSITRQQLLEATLEQWQKMGIDKKTRQRWIATLYDIFPDVEKGHQLVYVTDGLVGTFYSQVPSQPLRTAGSIEDQSLNDGFLSIWLGRDTQFPDLRLQLIGVNEQ